MPKGALLSLTLSFSLSLYPVRVHQSRNDSFEMNGQSFRNDEISLLLDRYSLLAKRSFARETGY